MANDKLPRRELSTRKGQEPSHGKGTLINAVDSANLLSQNE